MIDSFDYTHPLFDQPRASPRSSSSGGCRDGATPGSAAAYFGYGFHEDGLQSGLAVAEALGGVRRPWSVANESGRITLAPHAGGRRMSIHSALYAGDVVHARYRPTRHTAALPRLLAAARSR